MIPRMVRQSGRSFPATTGSLGAGRTTRKGAGRRGRARDPRRLGGSGGKLGQVRSSHTPVAGARRRNTANTLRPMSLPGVALCCGFGLHRSGRSLTPELGGCIPSAVPLKPTEAGLERPKAECVKRNWLPALSKRTTVPVAASPSLPPILCEGYFQHNKVACNHWRRALCPRIAQHTRLFPLTTEKPRRRSLHAPKYKAPICPFTPLHPQHVQAYHRHHPWLVAEYSGLGHLYYLPQCCRIHDRVRCPPKYGWYRGTACGVGR